MKNGKNPTKKQRRLISASGKNAADWLVCKDTPTEMQVINRYTNAVKIIVKGFYNVQEV